MASRPDCSIFSARIDLSRFGHGCHPGLFGSFDCIYHGQHVAGRPCLRLFYLRRMTAARDEEKNERSKYPDPHDRSPKDMPKWQSSYIPLASLIVKSLTTVPIPLTSITLIKDKLSTGCPLQCPLVNYPVHQRQRLVTSVRSCFLRLIFLDLYRRSAFLARCLPTFTMIRDTSPSA